jgi:hypothetical protein
MFGDPPLILLVGKLIMLASLMIATSLLRSIYFVTNLKYSNTFMNYSTW